MQLSLIQNQIISRLKNADTLRHRDVRPRGVSADLYNYHLKFLIQKGLVEKDAVGYKLSDAGRRYVADIHHTSDQSQRLFKLNVITIASRIHNGERQILNQRRTAQPSYGKVGVMGGTIIKGEPILEGAKRKFKQETGLVAEFHLLGFERRTTYTNNDKLFSDVLFPICYTESVSGELENTSFGENFWVPIEQAIKNESDPNDSITSIQTVLQAVQTNTVPGLQMFYLETTQFRPK